MRIAVPQSLWGQGPRLNMIQSQRWFFLISCPSGGQRAGGRGEWQPWLRVWQQNEGSWSPWRPTCIPRPTWVRCDSSPEGRWGWGKTKPGSTEKGPADRSGDVLLKRSFHGASRPGKGARTEVKEQYRSSAQHTRFLPGGAACKWTDLARPAPGRVTGSQTQHRPRQRSAKSHCGASQCL